MNINGMKRCVLNAYKHFGTIMYYLVYSLELFGFKAWTKYTVHRNDFQKRLLNKYLKGYFEFFTVVSAFEPERYHINRNLLQCADQKVQIFVASIGIIEMKTEFLVNFNTHAELSSQDDSPASFTTIPYRVSWSVWVFKETVAFDVLIENQFR